MSTVNEIWTPGVNDLPKINNIIRRKAGHTQSSHFGLPSTVKNQSKRKHKKRGEKWSNRHANGTKIKIPKPQKMGHLTALNQIPLVWRTIHRLIHITKTCSNDRVTAFCERSTKNTHNKHWHGIQKITKLSSHPMKNPQYMESKN